MKWNTRQKLCLLIAVLTLILTAILWLTMPDPVLSGVQVHNGIRHLTYTPKLKLCISMICIPVVGSLVWGFFSRRVDQKISAEPHLNSLRLRKAFINFLGLVYTCAGIWGSLMVLFLNM